MQFAVARLGQSLASLGLEAAILEGNVGASEVGVLKSSLGGRGHSVPVRDGVGLASGRGELELVVRGKASKVFDLGAVAFHLGNAVGLAIPAVAGSGSPSDLGSGRVGVIDRDDNVLPVVTVASGSVTVERLVLREVPSVHDDSLAVDGASTSICLALALVAAATSRGSAILKTTADVTIVGNGRVGLAAMGDVEKGVESLDDLAKTTRLNSLSNGANRVMGNSGAGLQELSGRGSDGGGERHDAGNLERNHCEWEVQMTGK